MRCNLKERYLNSIILTAFICVLSIFSFCFVTAASPITAISLRSYGGEITINGYSLDPIHSRLDLKLVEKDGICNAFMQISINGQNNERRVVFTSNMRTKDLCAINDDSLTLDGSPAVYYRSIPKIHKYPDRTVVGRIKWIKELLSQPEHESKIVSVVITKSGNYLTVESPFFSIRDMDVIDFTLKHS
jgi:hypothetical protein